MDRKNIYSSKKISLKAKELKPVRKLLNFPSQPQTKTIRNSRMSFEDPFDSMVSNGKSQPVLLPVLNKHHKNPSIPSFRLKDQPMTDRSTQKSLSSYKSEFLLPKILNTNYLTHFKPKLRVSFFLNLEKTQDIKTPCFSYDKLEDFETQPASKKSEKRTEEGIRSYKNFNEFSFGGK